MKAWAAGPGSRVTTLTSFTVSPFFLSIQASVKYGAVPGAEAATVLPFRSAIFAMVLRTTMPSAPYDLSSWTTCFVATPLAFHTIHVSTVVAAHCTSPEAIARCRSFCGMNLMVDVDAVLLEDTGLLGQRQRGEARPPAHGHRDLRQILPGHRRHGGHGHQQSDERPASAHSAFLPGAILPNGGRLCRPRFPSAPGERGRQALRLGPRLTGAV